jgi:catechol 2,3-dioxygenase-like lactoylglutathione lyase family enzyme
MISPQGLFEMHLTVADLDRAIAFYRNVVGLRVAHVTDRLFHLEPRYRSRTFRRRSIALKCESSGTRRSVHRPDNGHTSTL